MIHSTEGIILKRIKYGETSLIVHLFTPDKGRVALIVNGVRKSKAQFNHSYFQPMNLVNLTYFQKSSLSRLKEISMNVHFQQINQDILRSSLGIFLIEVLDKCVSEHYENEGLYQFLKKYFQYLDITNELKNTHLWCLIRISKYLGFEPSLNFSSEEKYFHLLEGSFCATEDFESPYILSLNNSKQLFELGKCEVDEANKVICTNQERTQLLESMEQYFSLHVNGFGKVKSLAVLKNVMS